MKTSLIKTALAAFCLTGFAPGLLPSAQAVVLYGITGNGGVPSETMVTINPTTAAAASFLTLGAGSDCFAIAINPLDGFMYHASGVTTSSRFWERIDLSVPSVATSVPLVISSEVSGLTWNPFTGTFLLSARNNQFYSVTTAGIATDIGGTPATLKGLAFVGSTLYGAAVGSATLYNLDPLTGAANSSVTVTLAGFSVVGINGLATDPDSGLLYGVIRTGSGPSARRLATIDFTTEVATDIGLFSGATGMSGLAFAVPEPTSALLLLGSGAMLLLRRRRAAAR